MADFVCCMTQEAIGNGDHEADAHDQNCLSDNGIMLKTTWPLMQIIFDFVRRVLQSRKFHCQKFY